MSWVGSRTTMRWLAILMTLACLAIGPVYAEEARDPAAVRAQEIRQSLEESGEFESTAEMVDAWAKALEKELGPEHPQVLLALHRSGMAFYEQGKYRESLNLFARQVELSKKVLGDEHPETLTALNNLAQLVGSLGDLPRARKLQEEVLSTLTRVLGRDHPDTLTALANLAVTHSAQGDYDGAREREEEVLSTLTRVLGADHPDTLSALANLAVTLSAQGDYDGAREHEEKVLSRRTRVLGADHPDTLGALANLAVTLSAQGDYDGAREREEEVLSRRTRVLGADHPDTLQVQANLAGTLYAQGFYETAQRGYEEVLSVQRRVLGAEHPATLETQSNLASTLEALGEYQSAQEYHELVLAVLMRELGANHPTTLTVLSNLAIALNSRGKHKIAREQHEKVLRTRTRVLGAEHPETIAAYLNLAATLNSQGEYRAAEESYEQVLAVWARDLGAEHPRTLMVLSNLAVNLDAQGEYARARALDEQVLSARMRVLGAEHPDTLTTLSNQSLGLRAQGKCEPAIERMEQVLDVRKRLLGSDHSETLVALHNLAGTMMELGDLATAQMLLEQVIRSRQESLGSSYKPSTLEETHTLALLAKIRIVFGKATEASSLHTLSLDALERHVEQLDFSEDFKSKFISKYGPFYRKVVMGALEQDDPGQGLQVLERYRSQSLMTLLRWNRTDSDADVPEELRLELRQIARRFDRIIRERDIVYPRPTQALLDEQAHLRRKREVIQGKIIDLRRQDEERPQPLGLEEIRRQLDPGTLLLSYSIGSDGGHLFVVDHEDRLEVHPIAATATQLRDQVKRLREIDLNFSEETLDARRLLSEWFFKKLFKPAAERIDRADRLLILPDGSLHYLHFAALTRPTGDDPRGWQYLAEYKPVHTAQSATVYAELRAKRSLAEDGRDDRSWQWVGFGDPVYPARLPDGKRGNSDDGQTPELVRTTVDRGIWNGLTDLPFSGHEIRNIAAQFPKDQAQAFVGAQATEDQARDILGQARIAHFAAHGLAYPDQPMDSFLALSLLEPSKDVEHNGLLQAWEIVDHLRLNADLVVLSACVTAFGPNRGGEGLISLSRAFQIAGARSVLASLWSVNDASTSELMVRFYRHLLAGQSKDEALRSAQLDLIRGPIEVTLADGTVVERDFSAPYHWAAFQLIGDYQ